jgi:hypothetical protein
VSNAELGENHNGEGVAAQQQIDEEIAKIKRYEVGFAGSHLSVDSSD